MSMTRHAWLAALREAVIEIIADQLRIPRSRVVAAPSLLDLAGFDSIAIVSVLTELEHRFGVEVPPEFVVPETFTSVDTLAGALANAYGQEARNTTKERSVTPNHGR
jgi:acyl carrier protein